jgi:hypothetical protein
MSEPPHVGSYFSNRLGGKGGKAPGLRFGIPDRMNRMNRIGSGRSIILLILSASTVGWFQGLG